MARPLSPCDHSQEWAKDLRLEMQMAIGQQLRAEYELPQELPPELTALLIVMDERPEPPAKAPLYWHCAPGPSVSGIILT